MKNYNFLLNEELMENFKVLATLNKKKFNEAISDLIGEHVKKNLIKRLDEKSTRLKEHDNG